MAGSSRVISSNDRVSLIRAEATCRKSHDERNARFEESPSDHEVRVGNDLAESEERGVHCGSSEVKVPRNARALLQRVIGIVKGSATRLAVYLHVCLGYIANIFGGFSS